MQQLGTIATVAIVAAAGAAYLALDDAPDPSVPIVRRAEAPATDDRVELTLAAPLKAQADTRAAATPPEEPAADAPDHAAEAAALRVELALAREEIRRLKVDLYAMHTLEPDTPFARWLGTQLPEDRPTGRHFRALRDVMNSYPIEWSEAEGLWLLERLTCDDWPEETADLSIVRFLGPARLMRELPQYQAAKLRADFEGEGVFR